MEVKESTTKQATQDEQGKPSRTQLSISHDSHFHHPGILVGSQDASLGIWPCCGGVLFLMVLIAQARQDKPLDLPAESLPAPASMAVVVNPTVPCVCQLSFLLCQPSPCRVAMPLPSIEGCGAVLRGFLGVLNTF